MIVTDVFVLVWDKGAGHGGDTQNFVECITEGINKSNDTGIRC
jgi:hypothetical protein